MQLSLKSVAVKAAPVTRAARPMIVLPRVAQRNVRMYAEPAGADEYSAKLQAAATDAADWVKKTWDNTADQEKPAAIAIIIGVIVAQIAVGATVDAVDHIPIVNKLLQLVGVVVTGVFAYRYFTDPSERDTVQKSLDGFVKSVTGQK